MIVNTCSIDTIFGNRTINLIKGDTIDINSDIVVYTNSLSLYKQNREADFFTLVNNIEIRFWKENNSNIMISNVINNAEDKIELFNRETMAIFSSIKSLEFSNYEFNRVSLKIINEDVLDNYKEYTKILLNIAIKFLKNSKSTEKVNIFIPSNSIEEDWSVAFEKNLGRTYYKHGSLVVIESLINSLKETMEQMYSTGEFKELEFVLDSLYNEIDEVQSLSINNIAINARKISEIISKEIASRKNINIHKIKYDLSAIINLLASKEIIAPWVIQYLHLARVFGNKSAHVETAIKYQPSKLYYSDFISILAALYNLLIFWQYNKELL